MIDHTRHMGIFNASSLNVCLIGAGGIGAITAITLGKMGVSSISVYDDDTVDDINIATQFYKRSDVGLHKVNALDNAVQDYSDVATLWSDRRIDGNTPNGLFTSGCNLYISTVDSISSRQGIWEALMENLGKKPTLKLERTWYLDARMGAEIFELFIVNLGHTTWYSSHIRNACEDDIPNLPCTSKATIYTANIAAGHIGATLRRIVTGQQSPGFLFHDILKNNLSFLEMEFYHGTVLQNRQYRQA